MLLEEGEVLRDGTPVSFPKEPKTPVALGEVGLWTELTTPSERSF